MSSMIFTALLSMLMLVASLSPAFAQSHTQSAPAHQTEHFQFYCPPEYVMAAEYEIGGLHGSSFEQAVQFMSLLCFLQDWRDEIVTMPGGETRDLQELKYHESLLAIRLLALDAGYHWAYVSFSLAPTLADTQRFFRIIREHVADRDAAAETSQGLTGAYTVHVDDVYGSVALSVHRGDYSLGQLCKLEADPARVDPTECPLQWINWRPLMPLKPYTIVSYDGLGFISSPGMTYFPELQP